MSCIFWGKGTFFLLATIISGGCGKESKHFSYLYELRSLRELGL